jgi:DNA-binding MarR family transcriptional regulator
MPKSYTQLANDVRHFTTRFWGPTLDVMASSIEILRFEGLIERTADAEETDDVPLHLTDAGRDELGALLVSAVRAPGNDFNKLVVALKLRFLDMLGPAEQREQAEILIELREAELARLRDLRETYGGEKGSFLRWLDHNISLTEADLAWFRDLRDTLGGD